MHDALVMCASRRLVASTVQVAKSQRIRARSAQQELSLPASLSTSVYRAHLA
jgi:hypothetical protein